MYVNTPMYIHELEAIIACDQSDGYLKKWAQERLRETQVNIEYTAPQAEVPVAV